MSKFYAADHMLDDFTLAYIEAALWTSYGSVDGDVVLESLQDFDVEDIDPVCLDYIIEDCRKFQKDNYDDIYGIENVDPQWDNAQRAGHDFWLTRNGHGSGFWDNHRWPKPQAMRLTKAAKKFGEMNLYYEPNGSYAVVCD